MSLKSRCFKAQTPRQGLPLCSKPAAFECSSTILLFATSHYSKVPGLRYLALRNLLYKIQFSCDSAGSESLSSQRLLTAGQDNGDVGLSFAPGQVENQPRLLTLRPPKIDQADILKSLQDSAGSSRLGQSTSLAG